MPARQRTTKPRSEDVSDQVSDASAWKKRPSIVTLPSGNKIRIRRATMQQFLAGGMIPNSLMSIVQNSIRSGNSTSVNEELKAVLEDPTKLSELMELMDGVTVYCALEPRVNPVPKSESDRDEALLYVDELDEADKTFIFNTAIGGTAELEQFRVAPEGAVVPVPAG